MELKQLRHFIAVVDHGTFSRAAIETAISQPALTRSIKMLEDRLGAVLLERTTRRVALTEAGARLYRRAKLILNEVAVAEVDVQLGAKRAKPIRLGMAPMFAADILPNAISAFAQAHPGVEVDVKSGLFDTLAGGLLQGELDLVFSNLPYASFDDSLRIEPLYDIEVVYLASVDHPLSKTTDIAFAALTEFPWAVISETHAEDLYGYIFASRGQTRSPIQLRTNSLSLLKSLVLQPPWITLLPRHMVTGEVARGDLAILPVRGEPVTRRGGLLYRKASESDKILAAFADRIREACRGAP
ncbi:MAG: LysR substrate-binding domain-containing protein [Henriciella sp.]